MNKHAKFWLTVGSFLSLAGCFALMILIAEYAKLTGNTTAWAILTFPPMIFSAVQTGVNYFNLTEDK